MSSATVDLLLAPALALAVILLHQDQGLRGKHPTGWLLVPCAFVLVSSLLSTQSRWQEGPRQVLDRARRVLFGGLLLTPPVVALGAMHTEEWLLTVAFAWGALHALTIARYALARPGPPRSERANVLGKGGAVRTATAAAVATGIDFSIFTVLLWLSWFSAPLATFLGAVTGGVVNFTLNRTWTFNASGTRLKMARRYVGVSIASALLNASFVAVLLWVPGQLPVLAWLIARGLVFLAWNYPLHRDYVFEHLGSRSSAL